MNKKKTEFTFSLFMKERIECLYIRIRILLFCYNDRQENVIVTICIRVRDNV
jgi:hypothetical protein